MKNALLLSILVLGVASTSCSKKKWAKTTEVSISSTTSTSSNEVIIAGKPFVMDTLTVDFNFAGITGERIQADDISITNSAQFQADYISGQVLGASTFEIPQGTYDKMELSFELGDYVNDPISTNVGSTIHISGQYFLPGSVIYEVDIKLDISSSALVQVLDNDNETRILLEEGVKRSIRLSLNTEELFSEINPGLWNAAAVTSVNGAQTIVVSELNNNSIYLGLLAGFPNSITAKFE
jgi:hypothetical protein